MLTVLLVTVAALVVVVFVAEIKQRPARKHSALRRKILNTPSITIAGTGAPVDIDRLPRKAGR